MLPVVVFLIGPVGLLLVALASPKDESGGRFWLRIGAFLVAWLALLAVYFWEFVNLE